MNGVAVENQILDVAQVSKAMRGIIKESQGVMACTIKRWPKTKAEPAHDVIYVQGGMSFEVPYDQRSQRCRELIDKLEAYGLSQGFTVIGTKDNWRIWFKRY